MKKILGFVAVFLFLSPAAFAGVVADWGGVAPGMNTGSFADTLGSKVEFHVVSGPGGQKALEIKSDLAAKGWGGVWHGLSADLSRNKALRFKVKTSAPGQLQVGLQDAYNIQYIAACRISSKDWTTVTIPLSSFAKNPYYTPPNARTGHPMDLSNTTNLNLAPLIPGKSVVEIGTVEAVGRAPAPQAAPGSAGGDRVVEDWYLSPFQEPGTFADSQGSRIAYATGAGPGGAKAVQLAFTLVANGWCGVACTLPPMDLSRNTAFKFQARCGAAGDVQMGITDANGVQYIAHFNAPSPGWSEVRVPFASFVKDPYYTPPGAKLGRPMDLSRTTAINFMPRMTGHSVLEIGPVEAVGTGGHFHETAAYRKAEAERKRKERAGTRLVSISRSGGTPISPFAFGNCYFDWMDWGKDGKTALDGTEDPVRALRLNVIMGADNFKDANTPELFNEAQEDRFIEYCRAVGAEPVMFVPVYGNNVDGGRMTAKIAADIVTYVNGTRKYGVKYWSIGDEVDLYDIFFNGGPGSPNGRKDVPVSTVSQYADIYNAYAKAMVEANEKTGSGVKLKFVGPELGGKYFGGNSWLVPMLEKCKDYIDVVSVHLYGFPARELTAEGALTDSGRYDRMVRELKETVARYARPGTPLAVTEANLCYDGSSNLYTPAERKVGPGTFYAAVWDADQMGVALKEDLWTLAFWSLAETEGGSPLAFIRTDPSKDPPAYKLTPEYYAQQMVASNFSGDTVEPTGAPEDMSVYACHDAKKGATAVLVINKDTARRTLKIAVEGLKSRTIAFAPMSINIVTVPDGSGDGYRLLEYTQKMADAGRPPKAVR